MLLVSLWRGWYCQNTKRANKNYSESKQITSSIGKTKISFEQKVSYFLCVPSPETCKEFGWNAFTSSGGVVKIFLEADFIRETLQKKGADIWILLLIETKWNTWWLKITLNQNNDILFRFFDAAEAPCASAENCSKSKQNLIFVPWAFCHRVFLAHVVSICPWRLNHIWERPPRDHHHVRRPHGAPLSKRNPETWTPVVPPAISYLQDLEKGERTLMQNKRFCFAMTTASACVIRTLPLF